MRGNNFIFSSYAPYWMARHLAFWLVVSIWYLQLCVGIPDDISNYADYLPLLYSRLPICIVTAYATLYILIPNYLLTKRYRAFVIALGLMGIVLPALITFNPIDYFLDPTDYMRWVTIATDSEFTEDDIRLFKAGLFDGLGLTLTVSGFAAMLRLMILYAVENSQNKRLQQQKVQHDLQLLKSQLNARFLFDTLRTIRAHVSRQSPKATAMVLKLSDLLSYVLYENDEDYVPLNKEIEIIEGYLGLEKEGHAENISVTITRRGNFSQLNVVPLLLLPLVESCFEELMHSERSQINLDFNLDGVLLLVTLKVEHLRAMRQDVAQHSIRIKNVMQRLASFYNGRHKLDISSTDHQYLVQLSLNL
jgi:sensor histidine kinase YesM